MNRMTQKTPAWTLALGAILSVQLSSALSVGLIDQIGPAGTAWLRTTVGAIIFIAVLRPSLRRIRRRDLPSLLALGATTAAMSMLFLAAIQRIPLGTAVAIEFLGPLTVAALGARRRLALVWPALALAGVVLLTEPGSGLTDPIGIGFAVAAAAGWAIYIRLTQHVGDRFDGVQALGLTIPVAAVVTAIIGISQAANHLTLSVVAASVGLALLMPVLPFALEMLALRRMTATAFGTLMALEPALGVLLGALLLGQLPAPLQILGILLVVTAGAAAQRGGARPNNAATPAPKLAAAAKAD